MTVPDNVLVIGASAAGLTTAEALRRKNYAGEITVLGDEVHPPYDRPPLSKQVLSGAWDPERAALRTDELLAGLDATFVLGETAVSLDVSTKTVRTASGRELSADALVIATGVRARSLADQTDYSGVHVLRTMDDSIRLRRDLLAATRLVVVGEGVLGSEIAATARSLGLDVTIAGPQSAPMAAQVGPLVSGLLRDLHTENGVHLRLGTGVVGLTGHDGRVSGVELEGGEVLPADVVVVAIGAIPCTQWLVDSGLQLDNGVVCDSHCRAADDIYAVGDVARWYHEHVGALLRLENRTNVTEQAAAVASVIVGDGGPYAPIPYFWTDQYDAKLQVHGLLPAGAAVDIVEGDVAARRFVARFRSNGVVTGILGWNMPKQSRMRRQEIVDALTDLSPSR
ncbi:NAD(P)/FAD-dependent oxidoreductase [Rhodococcus sp. 14-2470-1a]|uniref:NAD(P)/FAD-dependent oxidoreductase n=1 Tax=Rhodococcus sp. 14-2470-1a TaxID=2023150 RepID=UPI000B9C1144|nr:FAD-dependent oxidoreductase [Rhodococcus sp. 14-2470-1a]OZF45773.1 FAD-dependent oxidoreductase [Rhodococcus sp. 14-2470-1a]